MVVGFPNVSLLREASRPAVYLVVGDTKFWIVDPAEFDRLGLRWERVHVVEDGALAHLVERRLQAPPVTRASDVHFDCGQDFDSITGRWHFNCKSSSAIIRRDVCVAGWLYRPPGDETPRMPYVNNLNHGVEDVHFNLSLDAAFLERLYGRGGLSSALSDATYPGNPPSTPLPFADTGMPNGSRAVQFNSWILPGNTFDLHGELNAWHVNDSGNLFSRHFVGRGIAPPVWINPLPQDPNSWFPFHPLDPEGLGRQIALGDYLIMRGTLWQDTWHDAPGSGSPWDRGPTAGHAWLEMHPIDWVIRVRPPTTNARLTTGRLAVCTPEANSPSQTEGITIFPGFAPSRPASTVQVRTVDQLIDQRMTVPETVVAVSVNRGATDHVDVNVTVQPNGASQGRFKGSWQVGWREINTYDHVWVDDALPSSATPYGNGEGWDWQSVDPQPFSGGVAHRSALADGMHQHYFHDFAVPFAVGPEDNLFAHVYLDTDHPPEEVMLQWYAAGDWRRAYWGRDRIGWGAAGTVERRPMGPLPFTGEWVRLEVPAGHVGLSGQSLTGLAFTLFGGRATWDYAGARSPIPSSGKVRARVLPNRVGVGRRGLTVHVTDTGTNALVPGEVMIDGQRHPTNTHFSQIFGDSGLYDVIVDCPGYPRTTTTLTVIEPRN